MTQTIKLMMTGLALAALAGCGTAYANQNPSAWVNPPAAAAPPIEPTAKPEPKPTPKPKPKPTITKPSSKPVVRHGGPANSLMRTGTAGVALTFDDGPDPVQTPALLDLLADQHVKATFCLVGRQARAYPALVHRIAAEGHTLCNHSWSHSLTLGRTSPAAIRADLTRTNEAIHAAAPDAPVAYLRAPGGNFTPALVKAGRDLGMTSIYWDLDPRDWDHPAGESDRAHIDRLIRTVQKHTRRGSIILSHDRGQPDTIAAYRTLLPWLRARYELTARPDEG
ncbi:polysaccharide deacetylase family protein [Actinoplanes sp. NPDC049265]|uniref:polysaccharide deacetylase family protein n=1 Tax=Actinoplanes sp. NPDC049265 TaxID=3363902 RepID=UPI003713DB43